MVGMICVGEGLVIGRVCMRVGVRGGLVGEGSVWGGIVVSVVDEFIEHGSVVGFMWGWVGLKVNGGKEGVGGWCVCGVG